MTSINPSEVNKMDGLSRQELREIVHGFILKHQGVRGSTQKEAYQECERWARELYETVAFASFSSYRMYVSRKKMLHGGKMLHDCVDFESETQETSESVPIYEGVMGMSVRTRDAERLGSSRINENDKLEGEEKTLFLQGVVDCLNENLNSPKKRKWTMAEIREDCARRRKKRAEEFSKEVQQN